MNPHHYVSLPLAKRMKEAKFKQYESFARWCIPPGGKEAWLGTQQMVELPEMEYCDAYSVAELGDILPDFASSWRTPDGIWHCEDDIHEERADTEVDARALLALTLRERGII